MTVRWKVWQEGKPVCEYCAERKLRNECDKLFGIERKGMSATCYLETDSYLLYKFEAPMMILFAVILKALYTKSPGLIF
nr:hypothetical protein CFP56_22758 [Quercus suber]